MLTLHRELSASRVDLGLAFEYPHVISIHNKLVQARLLQPDGQRIVEIDPVGQLLAAPAPRKAR